jgi:hypothetical protein
MNNIDLIFGVIGVLEVMILVVIGWGVWSVIRGTR